MANNTKTNTPKKSQQQQQPQRSAPRKPLKKQPSLTKLQKQPSLTKPSKSRAEALRAPLAAVNAPPGFERKAPRAIAFAGAAPTNARWAKTPKAARRAAKPQKKPHYDLDIQCVVTPRNSRWAKTPKNAAPRLHAFSDASSSDAPRLRAFSQDSDASSFEPEFALEVDDGVAADAELLDAYFPMDLPFALL